MNNSSHNEHAQNLIDNEKPVGDWSGFRRYWRADMMSGFMVFLLALPLCLGISVASGFPPIAGVFTAVIGALAGMAFSNSELTIKGPAAGLIVILIGCIESFGGDGMLGGWTAADLNAYRAALAVGLAAAVLQIGFGLVRAGILGDFFPVAAIHGMLAAIGVIIISKQIPVALGVTASGEPLELLREIPHLLLEANPAIALIGILSIAIMFLWPIASKFFRVLRYIPSPVVVLAVAIPLGIVFDLLHEHSYHLQNHEYKLGEQYLVSMPDRMFGIFSEIQTPDFGALLELKAWKWVALFFIIGSLESVLSAKAIDLLDPWKRRSNLDRDIMAVGVGNLAASMIGGLPMISEIVRSKSNIDNGGMTRFSNFWHGMFLLVCVMLIPTVLHLIPLAALAGMLVYTGFRLAHPQEFINVYRIGKEQLVIFVTTLIAVLATDLLIGIAIGIGLKFFFHVVHGVPLRTLFYPELKTEPVDGATVRILAGDSVIFSNWIPARRQIEQAGLFQGKSVILDLSKTRLVDHSVMEKLHSLEDDFKMQGLRLELIGLDRMSPDTDHHLSTRSRRLMNIQRLTIVCEQELEASIVKKILVLGASGYTSATCSGVGRHDVGVDNYNVQPRVRIEIICPADIAQEILDELEVYSSGKRFLTVCVETVKVLHVHKFAPRGNS